MDGIYEKTLLYDFYGELLTPHQRSIYEEAVCQDLSLGEIAEEYGISRQGVHDQLRRCDRILQEYENKLHLVERFSDAKARIGEIMELTRLPEDSSCEQDAGAKLEERLRRIRELSRTLLQDW